MVYTTISLIKADIGSKGGHIIPSEKVLETVDGYICKALGEGILSDYRVFHAGDDTEILMIHNLGEGNETIHKLAYDAFLAGTKVAKDQGLHGAGQDLLSDAFSGNVRGMGPGVAEMAINERNSEQILIFTADKTDPGAFNLPLYLTYADPMNTSGLLLNSNMKKGYKYTIMDVEYTDGDRVIERNTPEDLYDLAALLRDTERFSIESIHSRHDGEIGAKVSTTRLHNIAGTYTGKDDPVMIERAQGNFPATGELLAPFAKIPYVAGFMRGSHVGPLMPVKHNQVPSFFDGPPLVSGRAVSLKNGKITEPVDVFDHPFWDHIRTKASEKALEIRNQGFVGPAMLNIKELEYGGIKEILEKLDKEFVVREK
ncbi:MAG: fructose-1,6-bisphosphatase [Candidatus Aenigmatarchaeota archaeon]